MPPHLLLVMTLREVLPFAKSLGGEADEAIERARVVNSLVNIVAEAPYH